MVRRPSDRRPPASSMRWTEEQHEDLKELAAAKTDPRIIARVLHRSEQAVRQYAKRHGIRLITEAEARKRRKREGRPP